MKIHSLMTSKRLILTILLVSLSFIPSAAQQVPGETIKFGGDFELPEYPGLVFRVSNPFFRFHKWDTEHTGSSWFSIALELTNNSEQSISAINFITRIYGSEGSLISEGTVGTGPMTFEPQDGNTLEPGYKGVYDGFITKDRDFYNSFGRMEFEIDEIKTVSSTVGNTPVFSSEWLSFDEYPGLEFQLSEPYLSLDDLSGTELFVIALKFKNNSGKPVTFMNFFVRVFDEIGPLYEMETQQQTQFFDPPPGNPGSTVFPAGYEGINWAFYSNEASLFDIFTMADIILISIE